MIWVTWRQHRIEATVVGGVLALLAVVLFITGNNMTAEYQQLGVHNCIVNSDLPNCSNILDTFRHDFNGWAAAVGWLNLIPALLGILIGAPLVARELEMGTHRLAWTQSVTRWRWLAVKLVLVLGASLVASALLSALLTWWRGPFDQLEGRFDPHGFDFEGIVPLAYVVFALALAIAAGTLLRRAIPAMALTLAVFLAVRLPIELQLRPFYVPPVTGTSDVLSNTLPYTRADWVIDGGFQDAAGHHLDFSHILNVCAPPGANIPTKFSLFQCIHTHGWVGYTIYQPASRFWLFQGIESAIFLGLAVLLLALTAWWVRRRIS